MRDESNPSHSRNLDSRLLFFPPLVALALDRSRAFRGRVCRGGEARSSTLEVRRSSARRSSFTLTPLLTSTVLIAPAHAGSASSKSTLSGRASTSRPSLLLTATAVHLLALQVPPAS